MYSIKKTISSKIKNGKCRIYVRVTIDRKFRPSFKSSVYVNPDYFRNGEIVIPHFLSSDISPAQIEEIKREKIKLDLYCDRLLNIILVTASNQKEVTKEWIETVMLLDEEGLIAHKNGMIEYHEIQKAIHLKIGDDLGTPVEVHNTEEPIYNLIDRFTRERNLSESRTRCYQTLSRLLLRYELFVRLVECKSDFSLERCQLTESVFIQFREYMRNEKSLQEKFPLMFCIILDKANMLMPMERNVQEQQISNRGENYVITTMKRLCIFLNWLTDVARVLSYNPLTSVDLGMEKHVRRPVVISIEERNLIATMDLSDTPSLSIQRDIFIFQCKTGCRYCDLRVLTSANISGNILEYIPLKLKKESMPEQPRVPLSKTTLSLIEKYRGTDRKGRLFPVSSMSKYNEDLKSIFTKAGLTRMVYVLDSKTNTEVMRPLNEVVSSHLARRTFVSTTFQACKNQVIVAAMSGHSKNSKSFDRYRVITDDTLLESIEAIE